MTKLFKKYFDVSKFVLWGEGGPDGENAKRPRLVLGMADGAPRFIVYTGLSGKEGVIPFPCDYIHMTAMMNFFKDVIAGPPGDRVMLDSLKSVYENNARTNEKKVAAVLHAGKTKDGIIYFSVTCEGRPKIVFPIKTSPWHVFRDSSKNPFPESVVSAKMASGIADLVLNVISQSILQYTNEEYDNGKKQNSTVRDGDTASAGSTNNNTSDKKSIIQDIDDLNL